MLCVIKNKLANKINRKKEDEIDDMMFFEGKITNLQLLQTSCYLYKY